MNHGRAQLSAGLGESADLLVNSAGASPKPGPTVGRPLAPGPSTALLLAEASSRRTRTDAGTMEVTVLSSYAQHSSLSVRESRPIHVKDM